MIKQYQIPNNFKEMLTKDFLMTFKQELDKVFNIETTGTLWSTYLKLEGTTGWHEAFTQTCEKHKSDKLYNYYNILDWVESDQFDDQIGDLMCKYNVIEEGNPSEY